MNFLIEVSRKMNIQLFKILKTTFDFAPLFTHHKSEARFVQYAGKKQKNQQWIIHQKLTAATSVISSVPRTQ
jgi:hypothetical protein